MRAAEPKGRQRRTKIVATIGPASSSEKVLRRLIGAGVDTVRLNLAHGTDAEHRALVRRVRSVAKSLGTSTAILADLGGPKIRVGDIAAGQMPLRRGESLTLTPTERAGAKSRIGVTYRHIARDVRPGDPILLAEGTIELKVRAIQGNEVRCEVVTGGLLLPHKGLNLPGSTLAVPALTAKDRTDIESMVREGIDFLGLSFVRSPVDIREAQAHIADAGGSAGIIAKIERHEALDVLPGIADSADGLMVARGDLGVEVPMEQLPAIQKTIIQEANARAKPVITATQMLESMVDSPRPTRAEVTDVANAILDGTDAVMLSGETATGRYPVEAVETMARIAAETDQLVMQESFRERAERAPKSVEHAISHAAVTSARDLEARVIVTPTSSGATARLVARYRPPVPIVAVSRRHDTIRRLALTWGVEAVFQELPRDLDHLLREVEVMVRQSHLARRGERIVLTAGYPLRGAPTNLVLVHNVS